ncbi:MAG: DnaJ C-terminal domain-containing protein [Kofleriaceae bacterium]
MSAGDIYSELGIEPGSDVDTVDTAYFELVFALAEATDPEAKARLARATAIYNAWRPTQPQPVKSNVADPQTAAMFDNLFASFFSTVAAPASRRGNDRTATIEILHAETRTGCTRSVSVVRKAQCGRCGGTGGERGILHPCAECRGSGIHAGRACSACNGSGRFASSPCDSCESGLCEGHDTVVVAIPPGTATGDIVRVAGKGDELFGGQSGDLLVEVRVDVIGVLVHRGDDTVLETAVSLRHIWFGGSIEVATVDGSARVDVPRGVRDGDTATLPGRGNVRASGMPTAGDPYRDVPRGDHVIVFRIRRDHERVTLVVGGLVGAGLVALGIALGVG